MKYLIGISFVLFLFSCGTLHYPYYSETQLEWETGKKTSAKQLVHSLFLVGDAGELDDTVNYTNYVLDAVQYDLANTNVNSSLVFLGDNLYPLGLPSKSNSQRRLMEKKLDAQINLAQWCNGNTYFIPGNHDWKKGKEKGLKAILRQEKYIESFYGDEFPKKVKLYPGQGCGDPKVVKIHKDLVFVFLDTQWWLQNWDNEKKINKGCEIKTRGDLLDRIEEIFLEYKNDEIVMLMHHPIKSNGTHGGNFAFKHHVFPLHELNDWLWIPLPVVGSVYPVYRQVTGSVQDISNSKNKELMQGINEMAEALDVNVIFAAGHEHCLQYFDDDERKYIISGSGSKQTYTMAGGEAEYAREDRGYAKVLFYEDNESWVEFYTVSGFNARPKLEFKRQLREPRAGTVVEEKIYPHIQLSDTTLAANSSFALGKGSQFFLGAQYRDIWTTPVKVPVINLETKYGGLEPIKKGGGMSSNSLRMQAQDGKQYILRSINKDYTKLVDEKYSRLKAMDLMKDQNSASHPYGALMLPPLSEAANVYYTKPELVFLQHQKQLGNYNALFPEELYLLEQRPRGDWSDASYFGNSAKIIGYTDLLTNLREKKSHFIDQEWVLKSRLFDLWVHDWDRHDDQWRWASFEQDDQVMYRPIPRDRDQVFYKFEGLIPWYASTFLIKKFKTMKENVRDVKNLSFNARYFDRYFLNQLEWSVWEKSIQELKYNLSDEIIENALYSLSEEVREQNKELVFLLKLRRDNMMEIGKKLYDYISQEVEIVGTDNDDTFQINRNTDGSVSVRHIIERGKKDDLLKFERTFYPHETNELRIYGLREEDKFCITGSGAAKIRIRIIGGEDDDKVVNKSLGGNIEAYDNKEGIAIEGKGIADKTSNKIDVNEYDRKAFKYNSGLPMLRFGYTKDDGLWFGGTYGWTTYGWRKVPYKSEQKAYFAVAPGSQDAFIIGYDAHFPKLLGKLDFYPSLHIDYPSIENYFGIGNETENPYLDKEYHWVRKRAIKISPLIGIHSKNERSQLVFGPTYESVRIEDTKGRVTEDPEIGLPEEAFDRNHFVGGSVLYSVKVVDRESNPSNGFKFNVALSYQNNTSNQDDILSFDTNSQFYLTLSNKPKLVFANNIGFQYVQGQPQFYQFPSLGNNTNLRGFRNNRFRGESLAYNNTDLRMKLLAWNNKYVPMDIGVLGGFDVGRVWLEGEDSNTWHHSQTFGIWMDVLELVVLQPYFSYTPEGDFVSFRMSYNF
ncbi:hypothetical protein E9993_04305 [Labilibacter sediminis]|nr:hypothetical protein E9993_04305 [Labilibacter sediminis]